MQNNIKTTSKITESLQKYTAFFSVVAVILIFTLLNPKFLSAYSIKNILLELAPLLVVASGITFVLLTGGIDLSTGAVASCTCVITGMYIADIGSIIVLYMIVLGFLIGLTNGFLVTRLKLPSFIVTLCATSIWKCVALIISGGGSSIIPLKMRNLVNWASGTIFGAPVMFWISLTIALILVLFEKYSKMGKSIFCFGANARAATMAGVNTNLAQISAFVICSVCSAIAGVMYAYKMKSSVPNIGDPVGLMAIAAVALGGTSLAGGKGSLLRTIVGVVTITSVLSGMNLVGVDAFWKNIVVGLILIVAVSINSDTKGRDIIVK